MSNADYYAETDSPLGTIGLRATARGLTGLYLEEHRHGPGLAERAGWTRDEAPFAPVRAQLAEYFAGTRTVFDLALDREGMGGTAFQHRVWTALLEIPYGETITYGELARRIGQPAAVRAVGLANGRNPVSLIVPCHRVIGSGGKLTGYGGGMERKSALLALEARGAGRDAPIRMKVVGSEISGALQGHDEIARGIAPGEKIKTHKPCKGETRVVSRRCLALQGLVVCNDRTTRGHAPDYRIAPRWGCRRVGIHRADHFAFVLQKQDRDDPPGPSLPVSLARRSAAARQKALTATW